LLNVAIDIQVVADPRTGVGQFTYHLVKALPRVDETVHYTLFLFDFRRRFRDASLQSTNVSLRKLPWPGVLMRTLWDWAAYPPLESLTGPFDLFHFTNYMIPPMRKRRALTTIYDMGFFRYPEYTSPKAMRWPLPHAKESAERALGVITVSEFSRSEIVSLLGLPREKVHVVYPGVSTAFRRNAKAPDGSIPRTESERSGPYILCVGTLEPRKNIPVLLRAYGKNRSYFRNRGCKLRLVGMKGWLCDEIFHTVRAWALDEDVVFSGYVDEQELIAIYRGARFAVFPSLYEGFGMPLLEAMASAVPVLASDIPAHREALSDAALFFEPRDEDGLAQRMRDLFEDSALRRGLAEKGRQRSLCFTWEASAAELARIYRLLAP
jgi:glycosyltransferase involved in cell wall biosynthesis